MKLSYNIYFDNEDGKFIAEKYFIDGEECSEEEYDEMMDEFDEVNDVDEETCECDSECCLDCEYNQSDFCDCPKCTIEKYIEIIQNIFETTGDCGGCIGNALKDFMFEIVDHIVIEDIDENEEYIN